MFLALLAIGLSEINYIHVLNVKIDENTKPINFLELKENLEKFWPKNTFYFSRFPQSEFLECEWYLIPEFKI